MNNIKNMLLVTMTVGALLLVGCASIDGGYGQPASNDVASDVLTERKILSAISDDPGLESSLIGVSCIDGVVTLRGQVGSQIERQLAEKIAKGVSGVTAVNNLITF